MRPILVATVVWKLYQNWTQPGTAKDAENMGVVKRDMIALKKEEEFTLEKIMTGKQ